MHVQDGFLYLIVVRHKLTVWKKKSFLKENQLPIPTVKSQQQYSLPYTSCTSNAGMKQYECGRTQPLLCMSHDQRETTSGNLKGCSEPHLRHLFLLLLGTQAVIPELLNRGILYSVYEPTQKQSLIVELHLFFTFANIAGPSQWLRSPQAMAQD